MKVVDSSFVRWQADGGGDICGSGHGIDNGGGRKR